MKSPAMNPTRPSILLLDDDADALEELAEIVALEGWPAVTARTTGDAWLLLGHNRDISIVVTDVHIAEPGGQVANGVDFVSQVREKMPGRALSFIVLSGDAGALGASVQTGVADFLTKPLMPEDLITAIRSAQTAPASAGGDRDVSDFLMRKVARTTEALQRVSVDLARRELEISQSRALSDEARIHGNKLRQALDNGHVMPWFQPQVSARTGDLVGFEALVRWDDPVSGLKSPDEFLPLAARVGILGALDESVQRQALQALASLDQDGAACIDIGLNLTAGQLAMPTMIDALCLEVERVGLSPERVSIEVLESAMLDDAAAEPIKTHINRLADLGFRIELDDFGTGHSGFSSLRDLAVSRIKIDRSFVCDVHLDTKLQKFTLALIGVAKALDIEVLAEGVECQGELDWLRDAGCDAVQGFFIARPMPAEDAFAWAQDRAVFPDTRWCAQA